MHSEWERETYTQRYTSNAMRCDTFHFSFLQMLTKRTILCASECVTNWVADRRFKWKRASLLALTDVILKRISMLLSCRGQHENLKRIQYLPYIVETFSATHPIIEFIWIACSFFSAETRFYWVNKREKKRYSFYFLWLKSTQKIYGFIWSKFREQ